jgi:hypothetical protein
VPEERIGIIPRLVSASFGTPEVAAYLTSRRTIFVRETGLFPFRDAPLSPFNSVGVLISTLKKDERFFHDYSTAHPDDLAALPGSQVIEHSNVKRVKIIGRGEASLHFALRSLSLSIVRDYSLSPPEEFLASRIDRYRLPPGQSIGARIHTGLVANGSLADPAVRKAAHEYALEAQSLFQRALPPELVRSSKWLK